MLLRYPQQNEYAIIRIFCDFNVRFDPEAARIVVTAPWANITSVCEVTYEVVFSAADLEAIRAVHNPVADFVARYSAYDVSKTNLWDEIAAAVLIDPSVVKCTSSKYLDVVIDHQKRYGVVNFSDAVEQNLDHRPVSVVEKLDTERFKAEFISCMTALSAISPTQ